MKIFRPLAILIFLSILIVPTLLMNIEEDAKSAIDNKMLTNFPLGANRDHSVGLTKSLEDYVSERIGFRDQMILGYTIANDRMFGEMVHPSYSYGKDGFVFAKFSPPKQYGDFEDAFVQMVSKIQNFCNQRNIPFIFVLNPSKTSVMREHLPDGYKYNNDWINTLILKMNENNITSLSNYETLLTNRYGDYNLFDQKYDAGHWNDIGAFFGVNAILEKLESLNVKVHINSLDEFNIKEKINYTLPVSEFPICEKTLELTLNSPENIQNLTPLFIKDIILHPQHQFFSYCSNNVRIIEGGERGLIFQGSYMNGKGYKYLQNSLAEYIAIHNYQNILNFEYYFNLFQPDFVVFEIAEYTFSSSYFNYERMINFNLTPPISNFSQFKTISSDGNIECRDGDSTLTIEYKTSDPEIEHAYLVVGESNFGMQKEIDQSSGVTVFSTTINRDVIEASTTFHIDIINPISKTIYRVSDSTPVRIN